MSLFISRLYSRIPVTNFSKCPSSKPRRFLSNYSLLALPVHDPSPAFRASEREAFAFQELYILHGALPSAATAVGRSIAQMPDLIHNIMVLVDHSLFALGVICAADRAYHSASRLPILEPGDDLPAPLAAVAHCKAGIEPCPIAFMSSIQTIEHIGDDDMAMLGCLNCRNKGSRNKLYYHSPFLITEGLGKRQRKRGGLKAFADPGGEYTIAVTGEVPNPIRLCGGVVPAQYLGTSGVLGTPYAMRRGLLALYTRTP